MEVKARAAGTCAADSTFTIPGVEGEFCKKCSDTSQAPIDGVCGTPEEATDHCTSDSKGACTDCNAGSGSNNYFLFEGGCYDQTQGVGSKLCSALQDTPDGTCKAAPTTDAITFVKDSTLYLCSDATNGGKENCGTCTYASNAFTCSECLEATTLPPLLPSPVRSASSPTVYPVQTARTSARPASTASRGYGCDRAGLWGRGGLNEHPEESCGPPVLGAGRW
ncbi:High cysteine protein [Giardia muris]|uniref:High cysteine protein n=1 Tax=Giardia muris TaxID=5742 RepID=A0A4Z1SQL2_GIAMU|nr:High cysteine protein [Giardia muris]|eukprot:TNJ27970.1 High cysteine protein [Giardia muris]